MPGRLLELHMENFRSLRDVTVPLGPLTVLVGPNGVGKSNLLKVFDLLSDIIRTDLQPALDARGGFDEVAFWCGAKPPTSMAIRLKAAWTTHASGNAPDEYDLTVRRRKLPGSDDAHSLSRIESFQFKRTQGRGRRISVSRWMGQVVLTASVSYPAQCSGCGSELECVGVQALVGQSIEWDISYHCSGCGDALYECGPRGSSVPDDLRRRLLAEHGEARLVLRDPRASPVPVMKVLRAELSGDPGRTKRTLQQIRAGLFAGTMPEMTLLAHRLRAVGVEAEAECPKQPDEAPAGQPAAELEDRTARRT